MKKVIAWLLVLALTAAISIGATLAYLTDTDEDVNVMTLGKVKIDQLEYERVDTDTKDEDAKVQEFHDNKPLLPSVTDKDFQWTTGDSYVDWGQIGKDDYTSGIWNPDQINNEVDKMVFVKNKGDYDAYVRTVFAFEAGKYTTLEEFQKMVHLNLNETDWTWEWTETPVTIGESTYFVATATYNKVLEPGALTEISLSQIALDKTATNEDVEAFGDTYQVLVKSQGIQADGFTDPSTALNEGFGAIAADNIPWENDNPTKGIDLMTALHYYEGGTTKITSKVSNVIFGKTQAHAAAVSGYDPVLMDVEQDVPANVYYVPDGDNYDIYILSDNVVYTPENSANLFAEMGNLVTVDTTNLDVSRTKDMTKMFLKCTKLENIDVSHWDTSNVTTMFATFARCYSLTDVDVKNWNTGNCTAFNSLFSNCDKLQLDKDALANWDMSSAVKINHMFYGALGLTEIDLSGWDVRNVETMSHMFCDCNNLEYVNFSGWQTDNLVSMDAMFNDCDSLISVDLSMFHTSKVREFSQLFESCDSLQKVIGLENFDTSSGQDFSEMFSGCKALKELDLFTFVTKQANIEYIALSGADNWMFRKFMSGCVSLEKLKLGAGFSFDGDGTAVGQNVMAVPAATNVTGWDGYWYDADGNAYLPTEIPEETAATYYAVNPVNP